VEILLRILRVKILAVQLGPAGFGMMSLYTGLIDMVSAISSLGIGQSAVRDIARSAATGDDYKMARTNEVLRKIVWVTGLFGLLVTVGISYQASWLTFNNADHVWAIAMLGFMVLFTQLKSGQVALLSGLRRIEDLAGVNVFGAILGTIVAVPLLFVYGNSGIVPFLLAIAGGQLIASWWFSKRVVLPTVTVSWSECLVESKSMVQLGLVLMVSGVVLAISNYAARLIIQFYLGEESVGIFQAAFTLSGIYIGFILQAMSGDYFPRLVSVNEDAIARNRFVNEQAEMAVLLAVPGLVGLLLCSDGMITLLYSNSFIGASEVLCWQVLGMFGKIISWPMGFILLACADKHAVVWSELVVVVVYLALVWIGVQIFGVVGAGMAFAAQYAFHVLLILWLVKKRHAYVWDIPTLQIVTVAIFLVFSEFGVMFISDPLFKYGIGSIIFFVSIRWSLYGLIHRLGKDEIMGKWGNILKKIGIKNQ